MGSVDVARVSRPSRGPRLFAAPSDEPRARRATDVLLLVAAATAIVLLSWTTAPPPGIERSLAAFLASFPPFLDGVWRALVGLLAVLAVALVLASVARRRVSLARDLIVAAGLAACAALLVGRLVEGSWPALWDSLYADAPPPWFPAPRIALAGAVVLTASPHLSRPVRRLGRRLLILAAWSAALLGVTTPAGATTGVMIALAAAAMVHLLFGSSGGRPGLDLVADALRELGVPTRSIGAADRQPAGLFLVHAEDELGRPLVVKVYGRDAHDTQLLATLWRTVWFRDAGTPVVARRLQQVEHEAFLTLLAGQAGVPTEPVVTAGATVADDALLVLRPLGRSLAEEPSPWAEDEMVRRVWAVVGRLHHARIAHGQLDNRHLVVTTRDRDGIDPTEREIGLVGFRGASVAPSDEQLRRDEAQALVATVLAVGEDTALPGALEALGPDGLTAALRFLQTPALTSTQRREVRETRLDLDELRDHAALLTGVKPPAVERLRRVTWGSVLQTVLLGVAFVALVSATAGLDMGKLLDELSNATWRWVLIGAVVAQLPRVSQAVSTLGASPMPLPLGHLYALQLAVSYVNLAIPASAARVAVNIRFFQKHGLSPGSALVVGALDGVTGFVVQVSLLLSILLLTPASLDLDLGLIDGPGRFLLYVLAATAAVGVVVATVGSLRRWVARWVSTLVTEAVGAVRGLRSPRRLGMLLGGNLVTEVLFALALGSFTRAVGYPVSLVDLLLINLTVALLSGLIPVPGGVGVTEAGLTYGLVSVGMPEEIAFAAVIMHRLAAFYLPPIWGFFAFRWLERNHHL